MELRSQRLWLFWGLVAVLGFQVLLGLYASALNKLFYANYGPFFDSLGYYNSLADMEIVERERGALAALRHAVNSTTVVYPWPILAVITQWIEPSRLMGVFVQLTAATFMQLALFFYFHRVRCRPLPESFVYSGSFVLIAAAFKHNGGLADFRMDLLQYFLFTTTMATYLIARQLGRLRWWALLGVCAGLLCLGRATSPVYLLPIFVTLFGADLLAARGAIRMVAIRWAIAAATASVVSGWYFISNFDYLYYYYVVWNQDANAGRSILESVDHLRYARGHVGAGLGIALLLVFCGTMVAYAQLGRLHLRRLNWRPLIFSAVPLGYLVLSGAGANPFVSITGVAGALMFLLDPIDDGPAVLPKWSSVTFVALLAAAGLLNAYSGIRQHTDDVATWISDRRGIDMVVQTLIDGVAEAPKPDSFRYGFVSLGPLNQSAIFNVMYFDRHLPHVAGRVAVLGESRIASSRISTNATTAVEWAKLPGNSDEEKIAGIVRYLGEEVDFLIVDTDQSTLPAHVFVNQFAPEIRHKLEATGKWHPISQPITINSTQTVVVLRNLARPDHS